MRVAPTVTIPETDRRTLQKWSRGQAVPARLVERARIALLAAEGKQNVEIADELGIIRDTVQKWRDRYIDLGLKGIERDLVSSERT